jgi:hypothetical protein
VLIEKPSQRRGPGRLGSLTEPPVSPQKSGQRIGALGSGQTTHKFLGSGQVPGQHAEIVKQCPERAWETPKRTRATAGGYGKPRAV